MIREGHGPECSWVMVEVLGFGLGLWEMRDGSAYVTVFWNEDRPQIYNKFGEPLRGFVRWQRGWDIRTRRG